MIKLTTDKLKQWAFHAFLFTVPIFYVASQSDTRMVQERYFQAAAMLLSSLFFGNIWVTLFFWLNMILYVIYGTSIGASQVMNVFATGLIFACSRNFFKHNDIRTYMKPLYVIVVLSLIMSVFQLFKIDLFGEPVSASGQVMFGNTGQILGLFYLPAFQAIFFSMMIPAILFLVEGKKRWLGLLLILPMAKMSCSAAFLGLAFSIPFIFYHLKRKLFIPVLIVMALAGSAFTIYDYQTDKLTYKSRIESWHMFTRYAMVNPLGWGPDSFRNLNKYKRFTFHSDEDYNPIVMARPDEETSIARYHAVNPKDWDSRFKDRVPKTIAFWQEAHNEFIQFFFEYGVIGVLLFILFSREIYLRFLVSSKSKEVLAIFCMLVVLLACSVTQFPFHVARITGIVGVLLGAYYALTDREMNLLKGTEDA